VRCFQNIFTDTDPPRRRPVGGGGAHQPTIFFISALFGLRHEIRPCRFSIPSGAIIPEKVLQPSQSSAAILGGQAQVIHNLLKSQVSTDHKKQEDPPESC